MPRKQRTIAAQAAVEGFGFWKGRDVRVEFRPAEVDQGIVFVRGDLNPPHRVPVAVEHRVEVPRRTNLVVDGTPVEMIEHVMAALAGLAIDNCQVWVDSPEMPGCDGSSLPFVTALSAVGIVEQDAPKRQLMVDRVVRVGDEESWVEARPALSDELYVEYQLDFGSDGPIGRQTLGMSITPESFRTELAAARTFILKREAEWLRSQGLGQRTTYRDLLVFDEDGPVDNPLRFDDECVRHKILDLVGDLALAGCQLVGHFVAHRGGHRLNAALVEALLDEMFTEKGQMVRPQRKSA